MRDLPRFGTRPFLEERRREIASRPYRRIELRPLAPTLGAEVGGVELAEVDEETLAELEQAHRDWKVLFFRDQQLSTEQHLAFARRFGELEEHPFLPAAEGHGEVIRFAKGETVVGVENIWHSDVSWRERPSLGSVLRAVQVPAVGGDTLFADMEAAYEGLPERLRERLEGLTAVHDFSHSFGRFLPEAELARRQAEFPPVEHPVIRTHVATGRKSLYVNAIFTREIVGLPPAESEALLARLYREAQVPEYQCRFRWEKGSVAFWDNRCVQHYAVNDYWPHERVMERATIIGERPV